MKLKDKDTQYLESTSPKEINDKNSDELKISGYPNEKNPSELIEFITLSSLSVRATNILLENCSSLEDLNMLDQRRLLTFQNCGIKTAKEILEFVRKIRLEGKVKAPPHLESSAIARPSPSPKELLQAPPEESTISLLPLFSGNKIDGIALKDLNPGYHASTKFKDLIISVRTKNVLDNLGVKAIGEAMLMPSTDLLDQKNFGRKSLKELRKIVRSLCLNGNNGSTMQLVESASIDYISYESMVSSFIHQSEKNKRNKKFLLKRFCFQEDKIPTLEELGQYFGITRERSRQILEKGRKKLRIKANLDKLAHFWNRLEKVICNGGGIIYLGNLPDALKSEFDWPNTPNFLALGQFLLLRYPDRVFKEKNDLLYGEKECLSCEKPLQLLSSLDFELADSYHFQVFSSKLSKICYKNCPWNEPVEIFHKAFIESMVDKSAGRFVNHEDLILSHDKWIEIHCTNLEEIICHILKKHGNSMHFTEIANHVRRVNCKHSDISDHNLQSSLGRYGKIMIVSRGTYGLKEWGLDKYRPVSTAIEDFLDKKGLPQRRQNIIEGLNGEYGEGNITASLSFESRFKSMGEGFYDRLQNWQKRTCLGLIEHLPEPLVEFSKDLVKKNNFSHELIMSFIFIRSMDENGSIPIWKLKDLFYNFYLTRHKKGLVVETEKSLMSQIGVLPADKLKKEVAAKPIFHLLNSGYFSNFPKNKNRLKLIDNYLIPLTESLTKDTMLIILLKAIDDYYQEISPAAIHYQKLESDSEVADTNHQNIIKSKNPTTDSINEIPSISIKKKGRSKIKI